MSPVASTTQLCTTISRTRISMSAYRRTIEAEAIDWRNAKDELEMLDREIAEAQGLLQTLKDKRMFMEVRVREATDKLAQAVDIDQLKTNRDR